MDHGNIERTWPGVFIAFEGIDGSGKSTVAAAVAERVAREVDREVVLTREPGGTPLGEGVRSLVLSMGTEGISPTAELLLFSAARAQHVTDVIEPHLNRGSIVICDRFTDSTLAYQWGGRGLPRSRIEVAQALATNGISPDLRVLLDVEVAQALSRRHADLESVNRFDVERTTFHESVRNAYLGLASENPDKWLVIDANVSAPLVLEATYRQIQSWLKRALPQPLDAAV